MPICYGENELYDDSSFPILACMSVSENVVVMMHLEYDSSRSTYYYCVMFINWMQCSFVVVAMRRSSLQRTLLFKIDQINRRSEDFEFRLIQYIQLCILFEFLVKEKKSHNISNLFSSLFFLNITNGPRTPSKIHHIILILSRAYRTNE